MTEKNSATTSALSQFGNDVRKGIGYSENC